MSLEWICSTFAHEPLPPFFTVTNWKKNFTLCLGTASSIIQQEIDLLPNVNGLFVLLLTHQEAAKRSI